MFYLEFVLWIEFFFARRSLNISIKTNHNLQDENQLKIISIKVIKIFQNQIKNQLCFTISL